MKEKVQIKKWQLVLLGVIVLISFGGRLYDFYWPKATVRIGGQELRLLLANNDKHRLKGLGDRKDLGNYDGMLFVFPSKMQHAIVMRDMKFAIDVVWLDSGKIVDMAPNVQPEPGRIEEQLTPYLARLPSTAILELPAGFLLKYGVKIGDKVEVTE